MDEVVARAVVRAVDGDCVLVEPVDHGCGRCHQPGGCGGARLAALQPQRYRASNGPGAKVGDMVEVAIAGGLLARLATRIYLWPLAGILAGAALVNEGPLSIVGGLLGGLLGYLLVRRAMRSENFALPAVVRVCSNCLEEST
jgi:sigma-E factor negative regulatory protein RseC